MVWFGLGRSRRRPRSGRSRPRQAIGTTLDPRCTSPSEPATTDLVARTPIAARP